VPVVAKTKSNFLLNGRIGFHAYQKLAPGLALLTEGARGDFCNLSARQERSLMVKKGGLIDSY